MKALYMTEGWCLTRRNIQNMHQDTMFCCSFFFFFWFLYGHITCEDTPLWVLLIRPFHKNSQNTLIMKTNILLNYMVVFIARKHSTKSSDLLLIHQLYTKIYLNILERFIYTLNERMEGEEKTWSD